MQAEVWGYRIILALSGITLILVVVYLVLIEQNRATQAAVNQRQQFINQGVQFGRINDALIRALATAAVSEKDDKLRDLLSQSGVTLNPKTEATAPGAAPAAPGAAK